MLDFRLRFRRRRKIIRTTVEARAKMARGMDAETAMVALLDDEESPGLDFAGGRAALVCVE